LLFSSIASAVTTIATATPTAATATACPAGELALDVDGAARTYSLTRPTTARRDAPILLLFHGYSGSPASIAEASQLPAAAAEEGWVVVAPRGSGDPSRWAIQRLPGPDDVSFVRQLIEHVARDGCADPSRVAAAGYSNGAGFTAVLTCELDLVASAMVGGANLGPTCDVPDGYPIVVAHGTADDVVPIAGGPVIGGALQAGPLGITVRQWRAAGASVDAVVVPGWGHAWVPAATEAILASLATVPV